tara:strand:- start:263 stop:394 length:132 start_codon:yes stop_codon:yes gene_type:complete
LKKLIPIPVADPASRETAAQPSIYQKETHGKPFGDSKTEYTNH